MRAKTEPVRSASELRDTAATLLSISPRLVPSIPLQLVPPMPLPPMPPMPMPQLSKRASAALGLLQISPKLMPAEGRPASPPALTLNSLAEASQHTRVRRASVDLGGSEMPIGAFDGATQSHGASSGRGCLRPRSDTWPLDMSGLSEGMAPIPYGTAGSIDLASGGGGAAAGSSNGSASGAGSSAGSGRGGVLPHRHASGESGEIDLERLPHLTQSAVYNKGGRIGIYTPRQRHKLLARWRAKRQRRTWRKKIRYGCRKSLADTRIRIKGRFVKKTEVAAAAALSESAAAAAPAPAKAAALAAVAGATGAAENAPAVATESATEGAASS
eukprot:g328.t1